MKNNTGETSKKPAIVIGILSACIFLYAAVSLGSYFVQYRSRLRLQEELGGFRKQALMAENLPGNAVEESGYGSDNIPEENLTRAYDLLKEKNGDYVFWLSVPGTKIDYPVVQLDNEFYLKHDFYGRSSSHGEIFLDKACAPETGTLLLHGHHMKDGTMFAGLKAYKDKTFRQEHREAYVDFRNERKTFLFFAAAEVDLTDEDSFRYEVLPQDEEGFKIYLDELKRRAFWYTDPGDQAQRRVLILSTCDYGTEDERLVVFGMESTEKD